MTRAGCPVIVRRIAGAAALLLGLSAARQAGAAGYGIYEQGSRALGMAGAFTAQASDPSAIFFNPAGLTQLEGTQLNGGLHLIRIKWEFAGAAPFPGYGVKEESPGVLGTPVNLYATHRLGSRLTGGIGVYNPFGLKTEWSNPDTYTGRFVNREASITPFYITPTLAVRLDDNLSVGGGLAIITSKIHLNREVGNSDPLYPQVPVLPGAFDLGTVDVQGNGSAVGFNLGARLKLSEDLVVGGVFRSGNDINYKDGTADFTYTFPGTGVASIDAVLQGAFPKDQKVSVALPFPATAALGFAFNPDPDWTVEVDGLWTGWSRLATVGLNFADPAISTRIRENWHDALSLRIGAEWRKSEKLALRGGWYYDESPQPTQAVDPLLPDADRNGLSGGVGFNVGGLHLDAYGLVLIVSERSTRGTSLRGYDGTYASSALIGGLNATYRF